MNSVRGLFVDAAAMDAINNAHFFAKKYKGSSKLLNKSATCDDDDDDDDDDEYDEYENENEYERCQMNDVDDNPWIMVVGTTATVKLPAGGGDRPSVQKPIRWGLTS